MSIASLFGLDVRKINRVSAELVPVAVMLQELIPPMRELVEKLTEISEVVLEEDEPQ